MAENTIFAMELCARLDADGALQRHLRDATVVDVGSMSAGAKWNYYHRVTQLLLYNLHAAERGCWDYFDDHDKAHTDFAMWTKGMTTAEGERAGSRPVTLEEPRYLTFTMAFLLLKDSPSDLALRQLCNVPEQRLWERAVFAHILKNFSWVSFASVQSDVSYLIPRDLDWSLTAEDLTAPKFHYLRKLV
ncbi:MAG: hypothetical protein QM756_06950 [Polyangiaceae bacterium]